MTLLRNIFLYGFLALATLCFAQEKKKKLPTHLTELKSRTDFDLLKGEPLSSTFNGIECIKLVYVLNTKVLYYLESKRYKWHYRFTNEVLGDPDDLEQFNNTNYGRKSSRKYILATFNYNVNTGNYFLQFTASDDPSDELIQRLTDKVTATFWKQKQFKVLLNTTILLARKKELAQKHDILTSDDVFKNQVYQPICKGKTKGILKFMVADSLKQSADYSGNILILKGSSNQLPLCKGVITDEFQTPLSHICLLTNNRKTPSAARKNIYDADSLRKLEGKLVELSVGEEKMNIRITLPDLKLASKKQKQKVVLSSDTTLKSIASLDHLSYKDRKAYGTKACNLAELKKLEKKKQKISTPEHAAGIPFYYYWKHMASCGADKLIKDLMKDSLSLKNEEVLGKKLKKIRKTIRKGAIDKKLLDEISLYCAEKFGNKKVRFRSSSNCEDEAGFNGAGLYTSQTGIVGDTGKTIEKAIKKVWASLWTPRAFKERAFYNIDHATVCMGILVHGAFDNEILNGVAITRNLYRDYEYGFVINMQKGENEVVSPKQGVTCEQVVSYMNNRWADFYNSTHSADWLSHSSFSPGVSLVSSEELFALTEQLESIKRHFYDLYKVWSKTEYKDFGMDVEFKLIETPDKKRKFVFKQARPYNN